MIELSALLWVMAIFFAVLGWNRGWKREMIGTAGIVLALFALFQFDSILRGTILASVSRDQVFLIQVLIFLAVVFAAYQQRSVFGNELKVVARAENRGDYQNSVLGALMGLLNGYLIWGTLWYFMDINEYPLAPYIVAPSPGSPSDQMRNLLPLVVLGGGNGDLLAIAVIGLFVVVLVLI